MMKSGGEGKGIKNLRDTDEEGQDVMSASDIKFTYSVKRREREANKQLTH